MDLGNRREEILNAVVKHYIATGEPIGSKSLLNSLDFSVSSATVRNEMAYLSDLGFLEQPHTSAGRVPSQLGYRYYIDRLMEAQVLSERERQIVKSQLHTVADDPQHILNEASRLLAQLTGGVSISTTPASDQTKIARIRLVQTGKHTAMMVMITTAGMVKNRLFRCDLNVNEEMLSVFEKALNEMLSGVLLCAITPAFIQTLAVSLGDLLILMPQALVTVMDAAKEASVISLSLHGRSNLLLVQDFDLHTVRGLMRFISNKEAVQALLLAIPEQLSVVIGRESGIPELTQTGLIVSRYYMDDVKGGCIAVLGPMRMNYGKNLAYLEYISCISGKLISELVE